MEILRLSLRYLHLVGFAILFGGFLAQYVTGRYQVSVLMRTGLGMMIGTGLVAIFCSNQRRNVSPCRPG